MQHYIKKFNKYSINIKKKKKKNFNKYSIIIKKLNERILINTVFL